MSNRLAENSYICTRKPSEMNEFLLPVLASVLLVGIAVLLLGVKVLFVKGGRFPSGHAHDNPELKRRGVGCHRGDN